MKIGQVIQHIRYGEIYPAIITYVRDDNSISLIFWAFGLWNEDISVPQYNAFNPQESYWREIV